MQQEHIDLIQSNFKSLVDRTDLDSVVTSLYERGVFNEAMIEPYRKTEVPETERKRKLYRDIMRRGPRAFTHLVDVLSETGHWDIVRELDPNSPYHPYAPASSKRDLRQPEGDNFVSLSTQKIKMKNEMQKSGHNSGMLNPLPLEKPPASIPEPLIITPQFEVIKSTKFIEEDDTKGFPLYRTRGPQRGLLLVFSYTSFNNDIEEARSGVDVDNENLKHLFTQIGFKVVLYQNITKETTLAYLKSLNEQIEGVESVFVVVSSHGYETSGSDTHVRCSDGTHISTYEIIEHFNNRNLPTLVGVPKVFIFQTCRGRSEDFLWRSAPAHMRRPRHSTDPRDPSGPSDPNVAHDGTSAVSADVGERVYSDILIAHSTLPGFVSRRHKTMGSWYIQVLCKIFAERAHNCHVLDLLTFVDTELQSKFMVQTSSIDNWGFNYRLYLNPGLFE